MSSTLGRAAHTFLPPIAVFALFGVGLLAAGVPPAWALGVLALLLVGVLAGVGHTPHPRFAVGVRGRVTEREVVRHVYCDDCGPTRCGAVAASTDANWCCSGRRCGPSRRARTSTVASVPTTRRSRRSEERRRPNPSGPSRRPRYRPSRRGSRRRASRRGGGPPARRRRGRWRLPRGARGHSHTRVRWASRGRRVRPRP